MTPRLISLCYVGIGFLWIFFPKAGDPAWVHSLRSLLTSVDPWRANLDGLLGILGSGVLIYLGGILARGRTTDIAATESRLRILSLAVEQGPAAVIVTDNRGAIEYVNRRFCAISGYDAADVLGRTPEFLKSGYMPQSLYRDLWETVLAGNEWQGELYNKRKDGELYWSQIKISPICDMGGKISHLLGVSEDISLRKRYEERLLHQANFDQLTSLPNRVLAFDRLCQALNLAQRDQRPLTIMQIDLDQFKVVNDTLGHAAGDAVLLEAARRLQSCVRKTDTVARLGSDEFLVILADRNNDEPSDVVARRVLEAFNHPIHLDQTEIFVSVSIGLSVSPGDGSDPQILLQNCGVAMSRAKGIGRNSYHFFTPGMNQQAAERLDIETQLRRALERSEFSLVFQPVLDLASDLMTGCEALLRWDSPILGQITPDRFIPLAEDTGLIVPIGAWVLKQACLEAKQWLDQGWNLSIAVNLSPRQLRHPGLIDDVTLALKESGLPAERLELEVTESVLIDDPIRAAAVLKELNDLRIRLSIDDFGTGYSSLSYLKRFPFQSLKIDRSFIRDPLSDPNDRALIKAIIALAKSLNLRVVAEGVETYAQLDFLRDQGCDVAQGFHFCRPLPALQTDDFARRFAARLDQPSHGLPPGGVERWTGAA